MNLTALPEDLPRHFLRPCMIAVHRDPCVITTLLGSCVAVCLWEPRLAIGGMNHFMLPFWNGQGLPTPKFGNIAIERLLERMLQLGCRQERLVAKVFGGASVVAMEQDVFSIGPRNIAVAEATLARLKIPLAAQETGGTRGMKIHFQTRTGVVFHGFIRGTPHSPTSA